MFHLCEYRHRSLFHICPVKMPNLYPKTSCTATPSSYTRALHTLFNCFYNSSSKYILSSSSMTSVAISSASSSNVCDTLVLDQQQRQMCVDQRWRYLLKHLWYCIVKKQHNRIYQETYVYMEMF